jgi:hypothetical protein
MEYGIWNFKYSPNFKYICKKIMLTIANLQTSASYIMCISSNKSALLFVFNAQIILFKGLVTI